VIGGGLSGKDIMGRREVVNVEEQWMEFVFDLE
jgi:hypothetical protein